MSHVVAEPVLPSGSHPVRVMFYVQHLLGIGHVKRASLLVRGWLAAGLNVTVVSGGEPVPQFGFDGATLVQLPPVRARDADFSGLVDTDGQELDSAFKQRRTAMLLDTLERVQPQLLVIENYPFGRRQLRWELLPLLQRARQLSAAPRLVCSVRDILQARSPKRIEETLELIDQFFDAVLIHGDADFIPLQHSFPRCQEFSDKLRYTGYVIDDPEAGLSVPESVPEQAPVDEVLVSAGGGAVGFALMKSCLQALAQPALFGEIPILFGEIPSADESGAALPAPRGWRFLLGPNVSDDQRQQLQVMQTSIDSNRFDVVIEPVRTDFPQLLQRCRLSISQGGYNTLMDLLAAGCAAVVVPFEGSGETEQLARTERLAQLGLCQMLREAELTPEQLAQSVVAALSAPVPTSIQLDCNGAAHSAQILKDLLTHVDSHADNHADSHAGNGQQ